MPSIQFNEKVDWIEDGTYDMHDCNSRRSQEDSIWIEKELIEYE